MSDSDKRNRIEVRLERARRKVDRLSEKLKAIDTPTTGRVPVLINTNAHQFKDCGLLIGDVEQCLRSHGIDPAITLKESKADVFRLAERCAKDGEPLLIVAGGDGTIEKAASRLACSETALGILPLGTMNNLARSLGLPETLEEACALIARGPRRSIDVALMRHGKSDKQDQERTFLETAGVGLSAIVGPLGQHAEKGRWGKALDALTSAVSHPMMRMRIECDDGECIDCEAQVVTISNAPFFGSHAVIAPDAKLDDGLLDLAIYAGMNKVQLAGHLVSISDGRYRHDDHVTIRQSRRISVTAAKPLNANADLNILKAGRRFVIEAMPGALTVIAENGPGLRYKPNDQNDHR